MGGHAVSRKPAGCTRPGPTKNSVYPYILGLFAHPPLQKLVKVTLTSCLGLGLPLCFHHLGGPTFLCYPEIMTKSIRVIPKKRGRPKTTGKGTLIGVRLQPSGLTSLDTWIGDQEDSPSRPEAIRRLITAMLHILAKDPGENARAKKR
jgi:hypothetical protein